MPNDVITPPGQRSESRNPTTSPSRWRLLGLPVDRVDMDAATQVVVALIERTRRERGARSGHSTSGDCPTIQQIVTLNPEMVMSARKDASLRDVIQRRAALVTPDGVGLVWASRLLGGGLTQRVAGVDLIERLAPIAAERGYRLFLVGAGRGVATEAARGLRARSPGLLIAGVHDGSSSESDADAILAAIQDAQPDLICVAFGSPAQELWLANHSQQLGAVVAIGVGGAFDFIAGAVKRAPGWMRTLGLEWLYRLVRQPWRWRRMLALPRFVGAVLGEWVRAWPRPRMNVGA